MPFDPNLAAIRFGMGLSPMTAPPASEAEIMARLRGPDEAAQSFPIALYESLIPQLARFHDVERLALRGDGEERDVARERVSELRRAMQGRAKADARSALARMVTSEDALRERLVLFWSDHFTAHGKNGDWLPQTASYVEEAIRPHVAGSFREMLAAVSLHPMMLHYLDQDDSAGPDSQAGLNRGLGLNENFARELLELHTLGVGGPYDQTDVRELAKLLTGLTTDRGAMVYRPRWSQPGAEIVLGRAYAERGGLRPIRAALDDLALHPATAAHLAHKLAVHFVSDDPAPALVEELTSVFIDTSGNLASLTEVLLQHPTSWGAERVKIRRPVEFVVASLRALGVSGQDIVQWSDRETEDRFLRPLERMGQIWLRPPGPDGWPEEPEAWATPQGIAGRIEWAMREPEGIMDELPDPRDFAAAALGSLASETVRLAAAAAEKPADGVGVVLASAEFQRR